MAKRTLTDAAIAKLSYEQAIEKIEDILESVESGESGLEDALTHCEDGAKLIAHCRAILDRVETRVANLTAAPGNATPGTPGSGAAESSSEEQSLVQVDGLQVDEDGLQVDEDGVLIEDDEEDDIPI